MAHAPSAWGGTAELVAVGVWQQQWEPDGSKLGVPAAASSTGLGDGRVETLLMYHTVRSMTYILPTEAALSLLASLLNVKVHHQSAP